MNKKYFVPEVLAPAGSLEKLKIAINYGANAVYCGGQKFGLRSAAENFTYDELKQGVEFAHNKGAKVYVVLNSFLHDSDLEDMPEFICYLDEIGVDAVIVSDLGVIKTIQKHTKLEIHLSTQATCLNVESAKLWKKFGVTRIVVGRELTIAEAGKIKREAGIEVEMFVHGSMCMAYSGNCVISNYTQGRDSNRGGCAHSCRFEYSLDFKDTDFSDLKVRNSYFMSSKDLEGLRVLPEFIENEIDSIKIEGRMKSNLYAGTTSRVYADALSYYAKNGNFLSEDLLKWEQELSKIIHRDYSKGSLLEKASTDSIYDERVHNGTKNDYTVVGTILEINNDSAILQVRNAFNLNDELEIIPFSGDVVKIKMNEINLLSGESVERSKPSSLIRIPIQERVEAFNMVRRRIEQ